MKIGAIVPYPELGALVAETFAEHSWREQISRYAKYQFELEVVVRHDYFENFSLDCDVIIARGDAAYTLRDIYEIPVVEIPIGVYAIEQAVLDAINQYHPAKVACIGFINIMTEIEKLSVFSGIDIKTYLITSRSQLENTMKTAISEGAGAVVCGVNGCLIAAKLGCPAVLYKSNKQDIWHAITEAKRFACIYKSQQLETERFKKILNYSFDGILTVDDAEKVISYNNAASKILIGECENSRLSQEKINEVIFNSKFKEIIDTDKAYMDEIIKYKNKALMLNKIPIVIKNEKKGSVLLFQDITRIQDLENKIRKQVYSSGHIAKYSFNDVVGVSKAIKETIEIAKEFSLVNSNVLIIGETGTGKEVFAQSIHNNSRRKNEPFVAVNCAALPDNLLESELFGYVEGAFTGASRGGKQGYFELAHQGTIFLDEISEISLKLQGTLLRVIQEKEIVRIGADKVLPIDVRIIAASNKDLEQVVQNGDFREDLYYRLDVLKIQIPSLNQRKEDIPLLALQFIEEYRELFAKAGLKVAEGALGLLQTVNWKGNIRQLRNVCERLVVINKTGVIDESAIWKMLPGKAVDPGAATGGAAPETDRKNSYQEEILAVERQKIRETLAKCGGDMEAAAREIGVSRATFYRKMRKLATK